jgi:hypothetical protein
MADKITIYNEKDITRLVKEELSKELFNIHKSLDKIQMRLIDLERMMERLK